MSLKKMCGRETPNEVSAPCEEPNPEASKRRRLNGHNDVYIAASRINIMIGGCVCAPDETAHEIANVTAAPDFGNMYAQIMGACHPFQNFGGSASHQVGSVNATLKRKTPSSDNHTIPARLDDALEPAPSSETLSPSCAIPARLDDALKHKKLSSQIEKLSPICALPGRLDDALEQKAPSIETSSISYAIPPRLDDALDQATPHSNMSASLLNIDMSYGLYGPLKHALPVADKNGDLPTKPHRFGEKSPVRHNHESVTGSVVPATVSEKPHGCLDHSLHPPVRSVSPD